MSVYQRNGHWYLSVTINGRRIRKAIKEAQNRRQAERAERILRNEIFENRYGLGGQKLFAAFVEESYKPYAKENKKGYDVERSVLTVLTKRFGRFKLCEVLPEDVERFKRDRSSEVTIRGAKRSKATVNRDVAVLSAVFNLAKDFGEINVNPVSNIKYYGDLPSRERVLSDEEEALLFASASPESLFRDQVEILLYTGLRRGELFKLEWRDIDFADGFINLRKEVTKSGKRRIVPMLSNVRQIFENLNSKRTKFDDSLKVFPGASSIASAFSGKLRKLCISIGLRDLTVHTLRHTFSTRADRFNVGVFAQRDILGHSRLNMTGKYTHPAKETLRSSLASFEEFIASRWQSSKHSESG